MPTYGNYICSILLPYAMFPIGHFPLNLCNYWIIIFRALGCFQAPLRLEWATQISIQTEQIYSGDATYVPQLLTNTWCVFWSAWGSIFVLLSLMGLEVDGWCVPMCLSWCVPMCPWCVPQLRFARPGKAADLSPDSAARPLSQPAQCAWAPCHTSVHTNLYNVTHILTMPHKCTHKICTMPHTSLQCHTSCGTATPHQAYYYAHLQNRKTPNSGVSTKRPNFYPVCTCACLSNQAHMPGVHLPYKCPDIKGGLEVFKYLIVDSNKEKGRK